MEGFLLPEMKIDYFGKNPIELIKKYQKTESDNNS
jgi:hypothetical protein